MQENSLYFEMYSTVCAAASNAIDALDSQQPRKARALLAVALEQAEALYVDGPLKWQAEDPADCDF